MLAMGDDARRSAVGGLARRDMRCAGDVKDDWHRQALVETDGRAGRPARQQRVRTGPVAHAGAGRFPARRARRSTRSTCSRRSRSPSCAASDARARAPHVDVHLRRRRRGLPRLGWVRPQGRARPVAAVLAAEHPELRVYASTPATCAPRCTRTPSPARTSPTGRGPGAVRRPVAPGRQRPPSGRYRAADLPRWRRRDRGARDPVRPPGRACRDRTTGGARGCAGTA